MDCGYHVYCFIYRAKLSHFYGHVLFINIYAFKRRKEQKLTIQKRKDLFSIINSKYIFTLIKKILFLKINHSEMQLYLNVIFIYCSDADI